MSGVLPVTISYPDLSFRPPRDKIQQTGLVLETKAPQHRRGTLRCCILLLQRRLSYWIATSTLCSWLCLYGSECVILICNLRTRRWKSVLWPTNAAAISDFRLAGMPISLDIRCSDSVQSSSFFVLVGYTKTKFPFVITIAPVCCCIDWYLDSRWSIIHVPAKYGKFKWIWSMRYQQFSGTTEWHIPFCVVFAIMSCAVAMPTLNIFATCSVVYVKCLVELWSSLTRRSAVTRRLWIIHSYKSCSVLPSMVIATQSLSYQSWCRSVDCNSCRKRAWFSGAVLSLLSPPGIIRLCGSHGSSDVTTTCSYVSISSSVGDHVVK